MKPTIIDSLESFGKSRDRLTGSEPLAESKDIENCPKFPDAQLSSGLLLAMFLIAIYSFAGGIAVMVIAACVLIVGVGLGILWNRHFPYRVYSITSLPLSSGNSYQWTKSKSHWITQNNKGIFFDTALDGCYL